MTAAGDEEIFGDKAARGRGRGGEEVKGEERGGCTGMDGGEEASDSEAQHRHSPPAATPAVR